MSIIPDNKDWTWTIRAQCPDCGYNGATFAARDAAHAVRGLAMRWPTIIAKHPAPTARPNESTWAPIEYACHVRDVFRLYEYRLCLMLTHDDPTFPNWDQDETALSDNYLAQDSDVVCGELRHAGLSLGAAFDRVGPNDWPRTGQRSDNKSFTIETFAVYMVHDPWHHLWDVSGVPPDAAALLA